MVRWRRDSKEEIIPGNLDVEKKPLAPFSDNEVITPRLASDVRS